MAPELAPGSAVQARPAGADRAVDVLAWLAAGLAVLTVLTWALVAAAHARDTYPIPTANGIWVSLAAETERGDFYRPLYDGERFGGTRYMPLPILAYAGGAKVTGDLVTGPKLVAYAFAIALFGLLYVVLRRTAGSKRVALGLTAVPLASSVGFLAATGVQGDSLPVLLQLAALSLVAGGVGGWGLALAGALCALGILAKFSALWAPAACLAWLVAGRDRTRAAFFGGSFALALVAGLATIDVVSNGRFSENLFGVGASSFTGLRGILLDAPDRLTAFLVGDDVAVAVLLPFVLVGLASAAAGRRLTVFDLGFVLAFGVLIVVLADHGTDRNHLLDVSVLAAVLLAGLWRRAGTFGDAATFRALLLVAVVWAVGLSYYTDLKPQASEAARLLAGRLDTDVYAAEPPAGVFRPSDRILSQDPYVPLVLGQPPVILDPFALLRILDQHPDWREDLIRRLDAREFDKVVLFTSLDDVWWWETIYFGTPLIEAIERNYEIDRRLTWRGLWILVPKGVAGHGDTAGA